MWELGDDFGGFVFVRGSRNRDPAPWLVRRENQRFLISPSDEEY